MNLLPKPVDKHVAALSAALLLSAFLLMLGSLGCRIIEPFWSANRDGDGIAGLIGRYTVAGGAPLDIRSGDLRVSGHGAVIRTKRGHGLAWRRDGRRPVPCRRWRFPHHARAGGRCGRGARGNLRHACCRRPGGHFPHLDLLPCGRGVCVAVPGWLAAGPEQGCRHNQYN